MKISKDLAISESGFIFNPITGESFQTNSLGILIIKALQENKALEEIKSLIISEFEVSDEDVEKDLTDFINMLKHYNLIIEN